MEIPSPPSAQKL